MGLKGLFLLLISIILIIFAIQNGQLISVVFFGFKLLSLPLYIWIIIAILAGLISSLIIQGLSLNSSPKIKQSSSSSYDNSSSFPPQSTNNQQEKDINNYEVNKRRSTQENVTNKREYVVENIVDSINEDNQYNDFIDDNSEEILDDFDNFIEEEKEEFDTITEENEMEESETIIEEKKPTNEADKKVIEEDKGEKEEEEEVKEEAKTWVISSEDNIPSESFLKAREASLYSFQSREKTEIMPKSSSKPSNSSNSSNSSQKRLSSSSSPNINRGGVYDATYRVISPPRDDTRDNDYDRRYNNDDEFFDDDDDWDF